MVIRYRFDGQLRAGLVRLLFTAWLVVPCIVAQSLQLFYSGAFYIGAAVSASAHLSGTERGSIWERVTMEGSDTK